MEFVEGETLRESLVRSPLSVSEAIGIGIQVATALAAAHAAGIVHRDIKPENIMLRPDGYVKVLDFGLAKLSEQREGTTSGAFADESNTSSMVLLGTVKYMSPEQASAQEVDSRSDIFSLGVMLYEMVAGTAPFNGESTAIVIEAIRNAPTPSLPREVEGQAKGLEEIIGKALAKKREDRYQSAIELANALAGLRDQSRSSAVEKLLDLARRHKARAAALSTAAVIALGAVLYVAASSWYRPAAFQQIKVSHLVETDKSRLLGISPDGRFLAHVATAGNNEALLIRPVDENRNTSLVPPRRVSYSGVTFSVDGRRVYFVMEDENDEIGLYWIPAEGGISTKILSNVTGSVTFSPNGERMAFVREMVREQSGLKATLRETGLYVADSEGRGEALLAKRIYPDYFSSGLSWSPDGQLIACPIGNQDGGNHMNVALVRIADGSERLLSGEKWFDVRQVAWLSDGGGLLMTASPGEDTRQLWFISFPEGRARRVSNDLGSYGSMSLTRDSSKLVVTRSEQLNNVWVAPGGDPGRMKQITFGGNHVYLRLAWTPDGRIVFPSNAGGIRHIWIMDGDGANQKQLTTGREGSNKLPVVSGDGRFIVFVSTRAGPSNIWRIDIDGSNPLQLTHGSEEFGPQCTPDGKWVFYMSQVAGTPTLFKIPIDGGEPVVFSRGGCNGPGISPDGRSIACFSGSGPSTKIAIRALDGDPQATKLIDYEGGPAFPLRWTSDGQNLIFANTRGQLSRVWKQPVAGGPPTLLADFRDTIYGFDWSADDKLVVSRGFLARSTVLMQDVGK